MPIVFVAVSKAQQEWGADVGLGKNLYKVGVAAEGQTPDEALTGCAGQSDWKVLMTRDVEGADEAAILERLSHKEKMVDAAYYPKLRGAQGVFKVSIANVENSILVAIALEDKATPKVLKVKPADIAQYLLNNAPRAFGSSAS